MKHYLKFFLAVIIGTSAIVAIGQENDDLYFTKKDRVKQKKKFSQVAENINQQPSEEQYDENMSFLGKQFKDSNPVSDEGFVSEESLEYYQPEKTQEDYQRTNDYSSGTQYQNSNFSNPQETYYDENIPQQVVVNNYYNDGWNNNWNRWNRPRLRLGLGFNSWGGNFWSVSYGNAWGNPWYDPFWDPWYGGWGPSWGWNAGWGWNSWAYNPWSWGFGFNSFWCPPAYGNFYGRPVYVVDNNTRRGRNVVRGARNSRGSVASRSSRSSSGRRASVASESRSSRADYSRQQADYLNRSRSSRYNAGNSRGTNSVNSRSANTDNASRYSSGSRSNSNTNFNRSSNTSRSNRSYTPPASRSSRNSSARPSRSSRSSGSVGRSSRSSSSRSSGSRSSGRSGRSSSSKRGRN